MVETAPVVVGGGGHDDNGRRDTARVSTAGLQLKVQCALCLMKLAPV